MDYLANAIPIHHQKLIAIVANLIAMVQMMSEDTGGRLTRSFHKAVLRVLFPAESAVRRLIVMAARGIKVEIAPAQPTVEAKPKAGVNTVKVPQRRTDRPLPFRLYDIRKPLFSRPWGKRPKPRVWSVDLDPPFAPMFLPSKPPTAPPSDTAIDITNLNRRLASIKHALDNLPQQAQRMAKWKARRAMMKDPKFRTPMRPGRAPGHRKRSREPINDILKECHAFAWEAMKQDTS